MDGSIVKKSSVKVTDMPKPGLDKQERKDHLLVFSVVPDNYLSAPSSLDPLKILGHKLVCAQVNARGTEDCSMI